MKKAHAFVLGAILFISGTCTAQVQSVTICDEYVPYPGTNSCVCYQIQTIYDFYSPSDCNTPTLHFRYRFRFGDGRLTTWNDIWVADDQFPELADPSPKHCFDLEDCPKYMDFEYIPGPQYCWYMLVPQLCLSCAGPCQQGDPTE